MNRTKPNPPTKQARPDNERDYLTPDKMERLIAAANKKSRRKLDKALDHLHPDDTLVVWRLNRLGRSR